MEAMDTLLLQRGDVASLLTIDECMRAVEKAFCLHARGKAMPPKVSGLHATDGGFHIKAGILELEKQYFVAKINANFPGNSKKYGLPAIQGVVVVSDAVNGKLLALMDSMEMTIVRTGAATGVAANYLASKKASVVTICGCGNQGRISAKALSKVRDIKKIFAFDIDNSQSEKLRQEFEHAMEVIPVQKSGLSAALQQSQIVITCTPSKEPFVSSKDIMPGTFIAAVGADNEDKQELFPELLSNNKLVTDITEQCISIGELHHAIDEELMIRFEVHAELGQIIAGQKPGRVCNDEIIVFDSTGTALQDVAAAAIVYEKAIEKGMGNTFNFSEQLFNGKSGNTESNQRDMDALRSWYPFR